MNVSSVVVVTTTKLIYTITPPHRKVKGALQNSKFETREGVFFNILVDSTYDVALDF